MTRKLEDALNARRMERNLLLESTDWEVIKALESGQTVSASLKKYRQALRDLPASTTPKCDSDGNLDSSSVTWPTQPS